MDKDGGCDGGSDDGPVTCWPYRLEYGYNRAEYRNDGLAVLVDVNSR
jgi:hypothetical protein